MNFPALLLLGAGLAAAHPAADPYTRQPGIDAIHYAFQRALNDSTDQIENALSNIGKDSMLTIDALGKTRRLMRLPLHEENIEFMRDTFTLRGSFVRPAPSGRHPAVLLLNGSGPSSRGILAIFGGIFAANGVAALVYDKRGTGMSTGTYTTDDFLALSEDVRAGRAPT
ncbi:MAG: hypothetical protein ABIT20_19360 [Gemmatimonadaceae bacterium]